MKSIEKSISDGFYSFEPSPIDPLSKRIGWVKRKDKRIIDLFAVTFYVMDEECAVTAELLQFISLIREMYAPTIYTKIEAPTIIRSEASAV